MQEALERVEQELERIGLLLEHDRELPSVTLLVAGEPIRGSWWGHRLGHFIYELLHELHERSGALDAKLIDGKVTYVHPRLWPAFLALARDPAPARAAGPGPDRPRSPRRAPRDRVRWRDLRASSRSNEGAG